MPPPFDTPSELRTAASHVLVGAAVQLKVLKRHPLLVIIAVAAIGQCALRLIVLRSIGALGSTGLILHPFVMLALSTIVLTPVWAWHRRLFRRRLMALAVASALGAAHGASLIVDVMQVAYFQYTGGVLPLKDLVTNPQLAALAVRYVDLPPAQIVAVLLATELIFIGTYWVAFLGILRSRKACGERTAPAAGTRLWLAFGAAAMFLGLVISSPFLVFRDPYLHLATSVDRMIPDSLTMGVRRDLGSGPEASSLERLWPRPLVLIVVDTLRADAVNRNMPNLRSLITRGWLVEYRHAYSTCTYSMCGILSILTGRSWDDFGANPDVLPDMLKPYGYTSHFVLSGNHRDFYKLTTMYSRSVASLQDDVNSAGGPNDDDNLLARLRRVRVRDPSRTFIYLHLMSEHQGAYVPDRPGGSWRDATLDLISADHAQKRYVARYESGARNADRVIGTLLLQLKRMSLLDDAIVIITADHAERLGPGRILGHGGDPDQNAMAVPLLVHDSRAQESNTARIASTVDVVPTFLQAIGIAQPPGLVGRPLPQRGDRDRVPVGTDRKRGSIVQTGREIRFELRDRQP